MSLIAALILTSAAATPAAPPPATARPRITATATARARILSAVQVRRINGRLVVQTGSDRAPTQVHRTKRPDGGETADFY